MKRAAAISCVALFALLGSSPALAGLFRAYVSSSGSDANECTVSHPCRLLPKALATIADGGEIWMLDSANYNTGTVNITKSVTILAIPGAVGSVVATGASEALFVSAAGAKITLRNLVIVQLGTSSDGIGFNLGAELHVESCEISNMGASGIAVYDTTAKVTIKDTTLRGNVQGFYARGPVVAMLDNVHAESNNTGILVDSGARVTVNNSVLAHNLTYGAYAQAFSGTNTALTIAHSVVSGSTFGLYASMGGASSLSLLSESNVLAFNDIGVYLQTSSTGDALSPTMSHNTISNSATGIKVVDIPSAQVFPLLDGNELINNGQGVSGGLGVVFTRQNNTTSNLAGNSATLEPLSGF
jgi:hypothetical protein